jgi:hypothetical protein
LLDHNIKVNKNIFYSNIEDHKCLEKLLEKKIIIDLQKDAYWVYKNGVQMQIKLHYKDLSLEARNKFKKDYPYIYDFFINCHTVQKPFY